MNNFIKKYSNIWGETPNILMQEYNYQPDLTLKLDSLNTENLNRELFYEIILWKLNRFPEIDNLLIEKLKTLSQLSPKKHHEVLPILKDLLSCHGIRLTMASTILRFMNPNVFQIIDDRVYRVLEFKNKIPMKPKKITENYLLKSCELYFNYIDKLHEICDDKLPFKDSDRILYLLDIKLGNKIGD